MPAFVLCAALFCAGWLRAGTAGAAGDCAAGGGTVVFVLFTGAPWAAELRTGVLEQLRAGLEPNGFRVCPAESAGRVAPVATVELRQNPGERVTATIEVTDGVTAKRVARDIDLSALPEDARALGVGVAADELLRASWVELSLTGAPKPLRPPPSAVRSAVESSLRVDTPAASAGYALGAVEGYSSGLLLFGGDAVFRHYFGDVFGIELLLGFRQSPSESSPHGSVRAEVFGARGSFLVSVLRSERFRVTVEAGAGASDVRLRGEPEPGSAGAEASSVAVSLHAGVGATFRVAGPLLVTARAGVGAPVREVVARDYGATGPGVSGFEWWAALGPGVAF